ncbi:MAG: hypothetical protein IT232_08405 [Flavobacteriales bacterium]|nr:hypothetical protein [Flavobacteriales bacterium]
MKNYIFYLIIGMIVILSFLLFSANFTPVVNSDDGVSILMLQDFKLPRDIFFWGQDRYGSIVPLLGQLFYKVIGLPILWAESITHYLILLLGYFSLSSFLKSKLTKVVFSIIWFLPISYFGHSLLRNVYGLEYSLFGLSVFLINQYFLLKKSFLKKYILPLLILITCLLSVWVSELAFFSFIVLFLIFISLKIFREKNFKCIFKMLDFYLAIFGFVIVLSIILFLKSIAVVDVNYIYNKQFFNSIKEIEDTLVILKNILKNILIFNTPNKLSSIYAYLTLALILAVIYLKTENTNENLKNWIWFLIIDMIVLFLIIILSHWVFLNGVARRYFTGIYIIAWLIFLLRFDYLIASKLKAIVKTTLIFCVLVGGEYSLRI